ncbi:unnamed protein product [Medioppia subpectinata]|uniref:F-box domain-containing protein n=1 Tax=Medioppia subpectinata TaxID=1979941 RepID=A0A7R9KGR6_9ACAR|nr:unnamed protein product [Medioppia subpectinata]CAG2102292.1 unnamed protein product [Medioppia subpectinata]
MAHEVKHLKTELKTTDDSNEDIRRQPQIYAKNSMDRFGDDLYEVLLSYLPLEDRFQCECVSKQFQRTVFVSVVDITLSDRFIQRLLNEKRSVVQMLATFAIKCPNIQTIDCRGITKDYEKRVPEVLGILRDYCRRLRDISCNFGANSRQMMATFGPLVTRIDDIHCDGDSKALTHCHRLSQLKIHSFHGIFDTLYNISCVKNIRKFELISQMYLDYRLLSPFVAANQSIESLTVESSYFEDEESVREMYRQLSRLTQLRELTLELRLGYRDGQNPAVLTDSLRIIGVNCKQLKRLALKLSAFSIPPSLHVLSLDSLIVFRRLKWLRLEIYAAIDDHFLEPLRHCKRLTQLELKLRKMTPKVVTDLHQYCPRLHYLLIHDFNNIIDTECLSHISRLPALQTLVIEHNPSNSLTNSDFEDLLSTTPKLKTIKAIENCCLVPKYYCHWLNGLTAGRLYMA